MYRRKFVVGLVALASGTAAAVGTGAFTSVEADRTVSIQVAKDEDAYLGLSPIDTPNSDNFVDHDENGHLEIDIADQPIGDGVNSNARTEFDGLFELRHQGTDATATVSIDFDDVDGQDEAELEFYDSATADPIDEVELDQGEHVVVGLAIDTHGVDATSDVPAFDGTVTFTATAPDAGQQG